MHPPILLNSGSIVSSNSSHIISNVLHDEIVIMDLKNGNYLNLNRIGSSIWTIIEKPVSIHELVQLLLTKYDVETQECTTQVLEFLNTLQQHNLLQVKA